MICNIDIWEHKPRVQTISDLLDVEQLVGRQNKEKMRNQLQKITGQYPKYRNVRGDGNCFYRSVAFLFLKRHQHLYSFERVFDKPVNFMLLQKIPKEFSRIYSNQEMWQEFQRSWIRFFRDKRFESELEKQDYLASLLNTYWFLDFLIVGYMRLLNHSYMMKYPQQLKPYIDQQTPWDKILQNVLTYGQDSQGLQLETMTKCLGADIKIIFVRQADNVPINVGGSNVQNPKVLLLTPGHYDILYTLTEDQKLKEESKILDMRNRLSLSSKINTQIAEQRIWSPPVRSRVNQTIMQKPARKTMRQPLFTKENKHMRLSEQINIPVTKSESILNSTKGSTVDTKQKSQDKWSGPPILRIHNANNGLVTQRPRAYKSEAINSRIETTFVKPLSYNIVQLLFWLVIGSLVLMFIRNQGWLHNTINF